MNSKELGMEMARFNKEVSSTLKKLSDPVKRENVESAKDTLSEMVMSARLTKNGNADRLATTLADIMNRPDPENFQNSEAAKEVAVTAIRRSVPSVREQIAERMVRLEMEGTWFGRKAAQDVIKQTTDPHNNSPEVVDTVLHAEEGRWANRLLRLPVRNNANAAVSLRHSA